MFSRRLIHKPLLSFLNNHLVDYATPANLNYLWSFGSLAGLCLMIQIATGIFLAMHYVSHIDLAFESIEHIMRDVLNGWLIRYAHANTAGLFFIVLFIHIGKGLYHGSYLKPRGPLWVSGVVIFFITVLVAFLGYTLVWGMMSFWGATVITNLASAIPIVGESIVYWLWGGFSVDQATLNRFFSLHFFLPFVIAALSLIHLYLLHIYGSGNPVGIDSKTYSIPFYPYLYAKDLFVWTIFFFIFGVFVFFYPNVLGHSDNYIPANPLVTPASIVPEFYLLPFYAILRSVPDKLGGVVTMVAAIAILGFLPVISQSRIRSPAFRPLYRKVFWLFVSAFFMLMWLGAAPVEAPYIFLGQFYTCLYFICLLVFIPLADYVESYLLTEPK